jgi:hypothetical protein
MSLKFPAISTAPEGVLDMRSDGVYYSRRSDAWVRRPKICMTRKEGRMSDTSVQRYRGVLCRCCNQPIALPGIIARLEEESQNESNEIIRNLSARVFTLRCGICEKEHPYSEMAIIQVEGTPRPRLTRANGARALGRRLAGDMARAAHAS